MTGSADTSGAPRRRRRAPGGETPRLVVDTSVLIAGLFGSRSREVADLWREGRVLLCVSDAVAAEYREMISRFIRIRRAAQDILNRVERREHVVWVAPGARLAAIEADPGDNKWLECAVAAGAEAILSADHHLLDLGAFEGIPVLRPQDFLASL